MAADRTYRPFGRVRYPETVRRTGVAVDQPAERCDSSRDVVKASLPVRRHVGVPALLTDRGGES
jgi:hypothetical protein